jgi:pantoate--beta-alanine ligase
MTTTPALASTREELAGLLADARRAGEKIAFVPTMGALHDGHASLVRTARAATGPVVVSIFVNPMQFAPTEDLDRYPRTLDADLEVCASEGVDVVFAPSVEEMYPGGFSHDSVHDGVTVAPGTLATILDGASRPGHFDGVLTVVAKLLHLTSPDVAYFGQKDAQQLLLIRRMAQDLDFPVEVVAVPTVRDPDGLAISSRNTYLTEKDREAALTLSRALHAGAAAAGDGPDGVRTAADAVLAQQPDIAVDYLALVDPHDLREVNDGFAGEALLAVAAKVGTTRLIDNVVVTLGPGRA